MPKTLVKSHKIRRELLLKCSEPFVSYCWLVASMCPCVKTRLTYLRSYRVLNSNYADAGEAGEDVGLVVPVRFPFRGEEVSVGEADGPKALRRHRLNDLLHQIVSVPRFENFGLAAGHQDPTAPGGTRKTRDHHLTEHRAV